MGKVFEPKELPTNPLNFHRSAVDGGGGSAAFRLYICSVQYRVEPIKPAAAESETTTRTTRAAIVVVRVGGELFGVLNAFPEEFISFMYF